MTAEQDVLAGYPVVTTLPVQWGEQDAFGHVNNIIYLRWFETGRIAYGEQVGLSRLYSERKIGPILAAVQCNFRRQITYPDSVKIGTRVSRIGRTSFVVEHRIFSVGRNELSAEGDSTIVVFDYNAQKPIPVPLELRQAVEQLEGKTFEATSKPA